MNADTFNVKMLADSRGDKWWESSHDSSQNSQGREENPRLGYRLSDGERTCFHICVIKGLLKPDSWGFFNKNFPLHFSVELEVIPKPLENLEPSGGEPPVEVTVPC